MNTLCLVIDRLHVGHVGAYGNSWIETPALDRLASEAFTADQFLIDTPHLESLYRSYWYGRHALLRGEPPDGRSALPELLTAAGVAATLLTDEPIVARHPSARGFDQIIRLELPEYPDVADHLDQTHLAQCFARVVDWLESAREPFMLWCHLTGLGGPWDAPLEFRRRYAEEDDPDPPDSADIPCRLLEKDYDPDELLGICQAYAGQVSLLDTCLGALLEFLEASPVGQSTLVMLLSARGFPLGEHRRVGPFDDALYGELVQVPLVMRFPDAQGAAARSQALVHPPDLWATLLDWSWMTDLPDAPAAKSLLPLIRQEVDDWGRDRLCIVDGGAERAIRTSAWYLRDAASPELFAKPDDRWEVNDVADRCADLIEPLRQAFDRYEEALRSNQFAHPPPLDEILLTGLD